jgi:competence protein ComEC
MKANGQPFLIIALAFAIGIIVNQNLEDNTGITLLAVIGLITIALGYFLKQDYLTVLVPFFAVVLGYGSSEISNRQPENTIQTLPHIAWGGTIDAAIIDKGKYYQTVVSSSYIIDSLGVNKPCSGKVLVKFAKDSLIPLNYGDGYQFSGTVDTVNAALNPGGFNYKHYLSNQHIYATFKASAYQLTNLKGGNWILARALQARNWCAFQLSKVLTTPQSKGVGLGLTLGIKDYVDAETTNYFQDTGTLHALAVSGAHLQVIFMMLSFGLSRLKKAKTHTYYLIAVLIGIWCFAFVTGWCASVLRAAIMFTVFLIGQSRGYYNLGWNQLGFSAFVLLLINPNYLFDIGFQLSYAAIAGIAIATQLWPTDSLSIPKIVRYGLETTIITIGATLGTAILSAYYFHQFPVWFLPANLIAVPLTAIILPATLLSIPLSLFADLIPWLAVGLNALYAFLINVMANIAAWPFAILENIYFDGWQCIGFYALISLFLTYYLKPSRTIGWTFSIVGLWLTIYSAKLAWNFNQVKETIVWHNPDNPVITYRHNGVTTAFTSDSIRPYLLQSLNNYAESEVKITVIKPPFKIKITNHCIHYQTDTCNNQCWLLSSQPLKQGEGTAQTILIYPWMQANYNNYQTAKSGAIKLP